MIRPLAVSIAALFLAACEPAAEGPSFAPASAAAPAKLPAVERTPEPQTGLDGTWIALQDRYVPINVKPSDPLEALEWTVVRCSFLGSEFGGDNSAHDRALNARMDELDCGDPLIAEIRAQKSRAPDAAVSARLDLLLANYG